MMTDRPFIPVLPVADLARARAFYEGKLGLHAVKDLVPSRDEIVLEAARGARVALERVANPIPSDHTVVSFEVEDVWAEVRALEKRGVEFEDFDLPGLETINHIATHDVGKAAWLKDPDGNIVCLHQHRRTS